MVFVGTYVDIWSLIVGTCLTYCGYKTRKCVHKKSKVEGLIVGTCLTYCGYMTILR